MTVRPGGPARRASRFGGEGCELGFELGLGGSPSAGPNHSVADSDRSKDVVVGRIVADVSDVRVEGEIADDRRLGVEAVEANAGKARAHRERAATDRHEMREGVGRVEIVGEGIRWREEVDGNPSAR